MGWLINYTSLIKRFGPSIEHLSELEQSLDIMSSCRQNYEKDKTKGQSISNTK